MTEPCTCSHFGRTWDCKLERVPDWWTHERIKVGECRKNAEEAAAESERDRQKDESE